MPIYKRKEFGKLYGLSAAYITTNAARGKIYLQGIYIDTDHHINKIWMENNADKLISNKEKSKQKEKSAARKSVEDFDDTIILEEPKSQKKRKTITIPPADNKNQSEEYVYKTNIERKKKELELKKMQEDYELAVIKKEKLLGELIPVQLVSGIFSRHFKSVTDQFYQACDNISIEMSKELDMDRESLAKIRTRLVDIINDSVDKSKFESKKEVKSIVDEYSDTRNRGEKK